MSTTTTQSGSPRGLSTLAADPSSVATQRADGRHPHFGPEASDFGALATTPPMGWNSWDAFGVSATEADIRANAEFVAERLAALGWEYIVVDLGWFAPDATVDTYKKPGLRQLIDDYGRLVPDPGKFPSAAGGAGFAPLAEYVHSLGLKFGLHIMRGIPWQAAQRDTPILGSSATARGIAQPLDRCLWFANMDGVNVSRPGGQAYYDSLAKLYAEWGVDFIKADDMNSWDGDGLYAPYHTDEIEALRGAIDRCGRPMVLSLSPGAAEVANAQHLRRNANMWRISCDFWDDWDALKRQFPRAAKWAPYQVAGHWPDADMLPIGKIGIRGEIGEPRQTNFTPAEQRTLMTLWCVSRSPLMFGGHLPESGDAAIGLVSNPEVIAVNQRGVAPREVASDHERFTVWTTADGESGDRFIALFNLSDEAQRVGADFAACDAAERCDVRDVWERTDVGRHEATFSTDLPAHGAGLYRLSAVN